MSLILVTTPLSRPTIIEAPSIAPPTSLLMSSVTGAVEVRYEIKYSS